VKWPSTTFSAILQCSQRSFYAINATTKSRTILMEFSCVEATPKYCESESTPTVCDNGERNGKGRA